MKLKTLLNIFLLFCISCAYSQGRIVFSDNGIARISGGAFVVVDNPNPDAITTINGGHFITEGDLGTNRVRWHIGTTENSYTVPFGVGINEPLPLTFSTHDANGNGFFDLSTYGSDTWKNSDFLPQGVPNINNGDNQDNSNRVADRFFRMEALNYVVKPNLKAITFPYRDIEHTAPQNIINEGSLKAQRWNNDVNTWSDYQPEGLADINNNRVLVDAIANNDLFTWWVLVDKDFPLPVELLSFKAYLKSNTEVALKWSTSQEINTDRFDIQRSVDGINFITIAQTKAAGNSQLQQNYSALDNKLPAGITNLYYRLKMADLDNSFKYSNIELVKINAAKGGDWMLYPNPVSMDAYVHLQVPAGISVKQIQFIDAKGALISNHNQAVNNTSNAYTLHLPVATLPSATYVVRVVCTNGLIKNFQLLKAK